MIRTLIARNLLLLTSPSRIWFVLLAYITLQFVLRMVFLPPASQDDSEQLIVAQYLAGGYTPTQPPLYTWLVIAMQWFVGPSVFAVALVKFVFQFATFAFMYLAARRALVSRRLAALTAVSLVAVYYIGWESVFNYSHTPLWAAAMPATLHALLCVRDSRSRAAYLYLGAAIGIGMLSKYGYFVFLGGLAFATLVEPTFRRCLINIRALATLAVMLLVILPHVIWILAVGLDLVGTMRGRLVYSGYTGYWAAVGNGLAKFANASVSFYLPLTAFLAILFPDAWWRRTPNARPVQRLLALSLLGALAIVLVGILVFGVSTFRTDYAAIFLLAPIYFFLRVEAVADRVRGPFTRSRIRGLFALSLSVTAVVIAIGIPVRALTEPFYCTKCYYNMPYPALAAQMRKAGFKQGTIFSYFRFIQIGGNLKSQFPDSRVISTKYPFAVPPAPEGASQCLLVWNTVAGDRPPAGFFEFAYRTAGLRVPKQYVTRFAEAKLNFSNSRTARLAYILLDKGC